MKIEEAIDSNKELKGELTREGRLEKAEAVQLSIEALKLVERERKKSVTAHNGLLLGETED